MANHKSTRKPDLSASHNIASSILTVTDSFLTTGFANDRWRPSKLALTKESANKELNPALACIHDTVLQASSTDALNLVSLPKFCKYKAM